MRHVLCLTARPCCGSAAGAKLLWGGTPLVGHTIPEVYGAIAPTAVFVPLGAMLASEHNFSLATTEVFGPFQVDHNSYAPSDTLPQ